MQRHVPQIGDVLESDPAVGQLPPDQGEDDGGQYSGGQHLAQQERSDRRALLVSRLDRLTVSWALRTPKGRTAKRQIHQTMNRWQWRWQCSCLLELHQRAAEVLGVEEQHRLPWAPILGLPSPATRAPAP